jgi:hypothetical protein
LCVEAGALFFKFPRFPVPEDPDLPIGKMYVMLSPFFLSTHCFH